MPFLNTSPLADTRGEDFGPGLWNWDPPTAASGARASAQRRSAGSCPWASSGAGIGAAGRGAASGGARDTRPGLGPPVGGEPGPAARIGPGPGQEGGETPPPAPLVPAVTCWAEAAPSGGAETRRRSGRESSTMSGLKVYSTSVTGSREIKSQQSEVTRILDGKNIKYELVDISQDNALREEMRTRSGNPKAIPPQIFNGDHYCGVRLRIM
ncbi:hypothetical protein KIL84_021610 [Mauremys mutica]|uniref:SH3 domain-binding glutamic acid-rich-like protein 3 n=1 Tax=Mauremys mutica TaxID=74926 RepID=A0A9D3X918_9SAUR|nr:hypothetical protein KIL84_021610 [Mauremys mutica]